jgi:hypothetical protein
VPVRYFKEASSINFGRSVRYGNATLWTIGQFWAQQLGLAKLPMFERAKRTEPQAQS